MKYSSIAIILAMVSACFGKLNIDTSKISSFVSQTLQKNEMQQYWSNLNVKKTSYKGKQLLDKIEMRFRQKHEELVAALERLAKASEDSFEAHWTTPITNLFGQWLGGRQSCCHSFFNSTQGEVLHGCELLSESVPFAATKLSKNFEMTSIMNLKYRTVHRQYFTSTNGVTTVYPKLEKSYCENFEATERPWFVQTMNHQSRQVVIILDNNPSAFNSMWEWYSQSLNVLKKSAIRQLNSLTPYDKVAVVAVSGSGRQKSFHCKTCFNTALVAGTEQNKRELRAHINSIATTGVPNFVQTFQEAFSFFRSKPSKSEPHFNQQIVFVSSSNSHKFVPVEKIRKTISLQNKAQKSSIQLIIFNQNGRNFQLEQQFKSDAGVTKKMTSFIKNHNQATITESNLLQQNSRSKDVALSTPTWTFPYLDRWGLGQVITTSLPVYRNGHVIGVAAVDSSLDSFVDVASSHVDDDDAYVFVVDDAGHVIKHPLLHRQSEVDLNAVDIESLEREPELKHVISAIKRNEDGEKLLYATRYQQRATGYDSPSDKVLTTFYWKKVRNTKFTVGLAVVSQSQIHMDSNQKVSASSLLFHRFDVSPPESPCAHYSNYATMKKSSLFLTSRAFHKKEDHQRLFRESNDVIDLTNYVIHNKKMQLSFKNGVRDEIIATNHIQDLWARNTYRTSVVWRHFTTPNGVFRIYPGIQIPQWYDPSTREWYHKSVSLKKRGSIISTPYRDPASHLIVVTVAQALYRNSGFFNIKMVNPVIGVTGQDIRFDHFYKQFLIWYPSCENSQYRCHMIDESGFTILTNAANHSNPQLLGLERKPAAKLHVTQMEPEISKKLIEDKIFQVSNCSLMSTGCTKQTLQIKTLDRTYQHKFRTQDINFKFSLIPIKGSNAYVLVKSLSKEERENPGRHCQDGNCFTNGKNNIFLNAHHSESCKGSYLASFINAAPCLPETSFSDVPMFETRTTFALPQCYVTLFIPFTIKSTTALLCLQNFALLAFMVSVLCLQKHKLFVSFRSLYAKLFSEFSKEFVKRVSKSVDVENVSELVKEDHLTEVLHNTSTASTETQTTQQLQTQGTETQQNFNITTPMVFAGAGMVSKPDQPAINIDIDLITKSQDVQVDLVYDSCAVQAAKLFQIDTPRKNVVDSLVQVNISRDIQVKSDQINRGFDPEQAQNRVSPLTLSPPNHVEHTSLVSEVHGTQDDFLPLSRHGLPSISQSLEDMAQKIPSSESQSLPSPKDKAEEMFQGVLNGLLPEELNLTSILTPEEERGFLALWEKTSDSDLSSNSNEDLEELTRGHFCNSILTEEEEKEFHESVNQLFDDNSDLPDCFPSDSPDEDTSQRNRRVCWRLEYTSTLSTIYEDEQWAG